MKECEDYLPGNCFQSATVLLYLEELWTRICICTVPQVKVVGYVQEQGSKRSVNALSLSQASRL